ncbi:MAG: DUF2958 domain-containing protein [Desulfobacula sp.]|nr:DUF2958 domain-containing protein [Desulfobacula sp.]
MWNPPSKRRLDQIPKLYETENIAVKDKLIHLHFYIFGCDWFVCEFDHINRFFGYAILNQDLINAEWGYFTLSELKSININSVEVCCESEETWCVRSASEIEKIQL